MPPDPLTDDMWYDALGAAILAKASPQAFPMAVGDEKRVEAGVLVYRNNVRAAYSRALADAFPAVKSLVGEEFFAYLARAYFDHAPPRARLVARYGDGLPAFLEAFEPVAHLPYLPDVARLEIAWLKAYHAAEATSLAPADIAAAAGENPDAARARLHPSAQLLESAWPAATIWRRARREQKGALKLDATPERVLVIRPESAVDVRLLSPGAHAALGALAAGATFSDAVEAALGADAAAAPEAVFSEIMAAGAITKVFLT
ncbi:HvfC/BufC N-terminal domain-containing protein [Amphiplicatus metriothermophilus]|uniref:Putative DNA-binding domain-containing protein n=1 Tax=Amphiplicatus metriothermophilus TaxID=1519374 RepID=A0A239PZB0_9PROT|nr:DNA-binding domain-containing protein [Amphiplicatus metriothermophilus]MBB5518272.1 hypothetical protein [Amphiplicatus metriothermophilus]SNT75510.1 Putative DNA-binding domain-containing protein [Amphiplicatus metriothermophilus]